MTSDSPFESISSADFPIARQPGLVVPALQMRKGGLREKVGSRFEPTGISLQGGSSVIR